MVEKVHAGATRDVGGGESRPATPLSGTSPDAELLARLQTGDAGAFRELVESLHGTMVGVARAYVRTQAVAEEVAQNAWLGVLDGLSGFEGRSSLKTWILRIVTNQAKSRAVREGRSLPMSSFDTDDGEGSTGVAPDRFGADGMWSAPPLPWRSGAAESALLQEETMQVVRTAMDALPPQQRAVIMLRDVEGEDAGTVCNILEIAETHQRVLLHRARCRVRAALEEHFGRER